MQYAQNMSRDDVSIRRCQALVIIVAAGLHLGLMRVFGLDLVGSYFGGLARTVYAVAGFSALWLLSRRRFR